MSHCTGMLAPGTEQLTALTSVNKLIAGDWRTTQPLCWNWLQPLSHPAVFNWFTSWKSVIYAHVQSLILQLDASCINLRELGYSFNNHVFSYQIQSKTNPQIHSHNVRCEMSFPSSSSWLVQWVQTHHPAELTYLCIPGPVYRWGLCWVRVGIIRASAHLWASQTQIVPTPQRYRRKRLIIIRPSESSSICFCLWPSWVWSNFCKHYLPVSLITYIKTQTAQVMWW